MRSIAIVTDSSAALPADFFAEATASGGLAQVDLPVSIAGQPLEGLSSAEIDAAIVTAHVQGEQVTTSGASPGELIEVYERLASEGYAGIISIHLSGALSGTCDAARVAADMVQLPVAVIDSENLAMALGQVVINLYRFTENTDDLETAVEVAEDLCAAVKLFFFIPTLDAIKRGGRVAPALAMVAQMFQIRPVATVLDGKLIYLERPRTTPKAIERLTELTLDFSAEQAKGSHRFAAGVPAPTGRVVAVHYCGNLLQAQGFQRSLGEPAEDAELLPLPPVLSAHSGLGALAAVVY